MLQEELQFEENYERKLYMDHLNGYNLWLFLDEKNDQKNY
jgi:hypothetical protein